MECPYCDSPLPDGFGRCDRCGSRLGGAAAPDLPQASRGEDLPAAGGRGAGTGPDEEDEEGEEEGPHWAERVVSPAGCGFVLLVVILLLVTERC